MAVTTKRKKKATAKAAPKKPVAKKASAKAVRKKTVSKKVGNKAAVKSVKKKSAPKKVSRKAPLKTARKKAVPKKVIKRALPKKSPVLQGSGKGTNDIAGVNQRVLNKPVATDAPPDFIVRGKNPAALFTLNVYRGEGMALLGMNWANGKKPPDNFVGFGIESREPGGTKFFPLNNMIGFLKDDGNVDRSVKSSLLSPIQKFRWIHFPFHPDIPGKFTYRVTPVFMDVNEKLSYGEPQEAEIQLASETYPGIMNIGFTRGFISSQAFVKHFGTNGGVGTIIADDGDKGLEFKPLDPKAPEAQDWMGFEARRLMLSVLDEAIQDPTAQVRALAYDLNLPEVVDRFVKLGKRLRIIIDDSDKKANADSPESKAAKMLIASAGAENVQRQHMGGLQHSKTIAVKGEKVNLAIGGSTNMSWRGLFVQNNNVVLLRGPVAAQIFFDQFDHSFGNPNNPSGFGKTPSAGWNDLKLTGINAKIAFSPHSTDNSILKSIADDINSTNSSLFYSLAFLYQTKGVIQDSIKKVTTENNHFVFGISDKKVGGLDLQLPNGNPPSTFPAALIKEVPEPFLQESAGGNGIRLHHKFVVIDFDKPTARVYTGSYNFSTSADRKNNENLLLIQDQRVAVSYMVQAVTIFDHYEFRNKVDKTLSKVFLQVPPKASGDKPWWDKYYTVPARMRDRELFSK
jgi:hypothetical protein